MTLQFVVRSERVELIEQALGNVAAECEIFPMRTGHIGLSIPTRVVDAVGEPALRAAMASLSHYDLWAGVWNGEALSDGPNHAAEPERRGLVKTQTQEAKNPKNFGIFGGGSIQVLGTQHRMWSFFECAQHIDKQCQIDDIELVTKRLYAKYIGLTDLPRARVVMASLARAFSTVRGEELAALGAKIGFEVHRGSDESLASIFDDFFEAFTHCADAIEINFDQFRNFPNYDYGAMRVVVSDIPEFFNYQDRSLDDYDKAVGVPSWLKA